MFDFRKFLFYFSYYPAHFVFTFVLSFKTYDDGYSNSKTQIRKQRP